MGISYNPSIVTEGLVLALDPQSPRFYNYKGRSVAFDGTGDYLSIADSADFDFGTGDFTVEYWIYVNGLPPNNNASYVTDFRGGNTNNFTFGILNNGGTLKTYSWGNSGQVIGNTPLSTDTWYHIAHVRSGSTVTMYLNGFSDGSMTNGFSQGSTGIIIGARHNTTQEFVNGYISNLRVLKGTALYTSNFTPPTEPLTAVTNTKLLTCQGNTISDASSSAHSITPNGNVVIDYNGPFSGSGWTDLTNSANSGTLTNGPVFIPGGPFNNSGGSVYFDGNGDYLELADSDDFDVGSGDFTIEFWVNPGRTTRQTLFTQINSAGQNISASFYTEINSSAQWRFFIASGSTSYEIIAGTVIANEWTYLAYVRNGNTTTLYVNGVSVGTADVTGVTVNNSSEVFSIGRYPGGLNFAGFISNFRMVKGTALHTSNFTPPTGPLEAVDDTVLLTCQGGAITDNGPSSHAITVNNDAEAITASAFEFDGTNDHVIVPSNNEFAFGTGDFTIEAWIYSNGTQSSFATIISLNDGSGGNDWQFEASGNKISVRNLFTPTTTYTHNAWHHVAWTRQGSSNYLFLDSVQIGTFIDSTDWDYGSFNIGTNRALNYFFNGKISNVRVYKGKSFTEDEVKRNFSALRGRYGI